ncbi:MAG: glycosyltransferase family 39 protein, partial [Verrucomicrobia bacterium]|nr:glycosyltransferase family 39 protein [Verrucomicrobiota bacterium]
MTPPATKPSAARMFFLGVAGYFALQIIGRTALGGAVELDSAVQLVKSQSWQWGYDVQPPLALVALKYLVLAGTCLFVFQSVKEMGGEVRCAIAAALGLALLPQLVWESQRDQTDSVLATMLAAAALWLFIRLSRAPKTVFYLAFGVVAALGCLSKYNYAVFLVALLLAAGSLPEFRRAVWRGKFLWSLAAFAVIAAPHVLWMASHRATVLARADEVHVTGGNIFAAFGASAGSLVTAVFAFSGLAVAAYAILFARAPVVNLEPAEFEKHRRLVGRILLAGGWLCVAMVVVAQARFKDRWMQPLLFLTPVWLALATCRRLDSARWKWLVGLTTTIAVAVMVILLTMPFWAAATGKHRYLNPDYAKLAAAIRAHGFRQGVIVAADAKIGGNLRLSFPDSRILGVNFSPATMSVGAPGVAVWSEDRD